MQQQSSRSTVLGILLLGRPADLALFSLWLDGFSGLGLAFVGVVRRSSAEPPAESLSPIQFVFVWRFFMAFFGMPYYLALGSRWPVFFNAIAIEVVAATAVVVVLAVFYAYLETFPASAIRFVFGRSSPIDS